MSDDRQEPPAGDADATRALPPDPDADATRAMPRNAAEEDVEATRAMPRDAGDATRPLPGGPAEPGGPGRPLDATTPQAPVGAWSGRAGVPPPRPAGYPEPGSDWYGDEQAGRRWWMPILLGVLALLLLGLIGVGVWLALRAADRDSDPGPPVPSISAQTSAAPTTAAPTTPSSSPPSTPPPSTEPVEVPMPPLVGLPEAAARAALDRLDLEYRVQRRASDRPAGTVISTDPEAGYPVGEDDRVTIVVAVPAPPTSGPTTPGSAPATTATP
ncbi:PASTA domain-containing protein [Micromonospora sp. WMMA1949]|uniref:PASTA domain-containing protein n=1 Tax=Micromonospora sp. WMMA1949 TaxID=3015162 RepID=UPI0022B5E654|nr:PASTA domain-containing protein [Micromonospora sp. WMMA1949]MCZ7426507.1 PASTA domain-containing protein [Micromonospora sp. WMMA1949]